MARGQRWKRVFLNHAFVDLFKVFNFSLLAFLTFVASLRFELACFAAHDLLWRCLSCAFDAGCALCVDPLSASQDQELVGARVLDGARAPALGDVVPLTILLPQSQCWTSQAFLQVAHIEEGMDIASSLPLHFLSPFLLSNPCCNDFGSARSREWEQG